MIKTIYFKNDCVIVLDQSRLPAEVAYEQCCNREEIAEVIRKLKVRGAPLIGVTAAFGLALAVQQYHGPIEQMDSYFDETCHLLATTRPTAVNLSWAIEHMKTVYQERRNGGEKNMAEVLQAEAQKMYDEDISINRAIGENGQQLLAAGSKVMTICNAGALATCGYGTALGVIRSAASRKKIDMVWACETRPVLQGARLTVWELLQDSIPVRLITDGMAGYTMKLGKVDAVIAGADRIAANGDTANKIGTYTLAVLAYYNNIPFYIAAPLSTIDMSISSGAFIPIEERQPDEIRQLGGNYITVPDVEVFNPAFDVTPGDLIKGIITERGVVLPPYEIGLKQAFSKKR